MTSPVFEQLYINGDRKYPSATAVVDSKKRYWHYTEKDNKVAIGKLRREPKTTAESNDLAKRCRKASGVQSISWYSFGRDVIEMDLTDLECIDKVIEAYKNMGYPIDLINY